LAVINVMLFPAAAIERSRLSSSSVHKRKLRLVMASVFRPREPKRQFCDDGCGLRGRAEKMMFGTEISRLDAKPFNIFTCVRSFFSQPAMAPHAGPKLALGPRYFAARSGFLLPSPGLMPKARICASSS
jgi:hypothetical protein